MDQSRIPCQIDPARLASLLGTVRDRFTVEALHECRSTSTSLLERSRQGAPSGQGILNAVHVYDRAQCPTVRSTDIQLGWNIGQTACWVCVGDVYRELPLSMAAAG